NLAQQLPSCRETCCRARWNRDTPRTNADLSRRKVATPSGAVVNPRLTFQERHAEAHQVIEGVPMHHMLAAVDNVEIDLWPQFFQQLGAFAGMGAVFTPEDHQQRHLQLRQPLPQWFARRATAGRSIVILAVLMGLEISADHTAVTQ